MKVRTRFFLFFLLLVSLGFYQFVSVITRDLRPRALATMEESMVETATLLASLVNSQITSDTLPTGDLQSMIDLARHWSSDARIYEMEKTGMNIRVYMTDAQGQVVYDSATPSAVGEDYSQWNDVYLTLRGSYGARTTRTDPDDPTTSVLHVAAPLLRDGEIAGVLTVAKPAASVEPFHRTAKEGIVRYGIMVAVLVILLGLAVSIWITWPIKTLTAYANSIRDGKRPPPPKTGRSEIGRLAESFEEMREALEGKNYVEQYIQTLTHEMKSPLSALRGAAELLQEEMPPNQRTRFIGNILTETSRIQNLVDRLLELSALENRKELQQEPVDLCEVLHSLLASMEPQAAHRNIKIIPHIQGTCVVEGEQFLLEEALRNLLQNAVDFTPADHQVEVSLHFSESEAVFQVMNTGSRIPEFARARVFERFYSLARPDTGRRSSGIGLTLVREIAELHGGCVILENLDNGVRAVLTLPREQPES